MLGHSRRRWTKIKTTPGRCVSYVIFLVWPSHISRRISHISRFPTMNILLSLLGWYINKILICLSVSCLMARINGELPKRCFDLEKYNPNDGVPMSDLFWASVVNGGQHPPSIHLAQCLIFNFADETLFSLTWICWSRQRNVCSQTLYWIYIHVFSWEKPYISISLLILMFSLRTPSMVDIDSHYHDFD